MGKFLPMINSVQVKISILSCTIFATISLYCLVAKILCFTVYRGHPRGLKYYIIRISEVFKISSRLDCEAKNQTNNYCVQKKPYEINIQNEHDHSTCNIMLEPWDIMTDMYFALYVRIVIT